MSGEVRVETETLASLDKGLTALNTRVGEALTAFMAGLHVAEGKVLDEVAERRRGLAHAQQELARADRRNAAACQARVEQAAAALEAGVRAQRDVEHVLTQAQALHRRSEVEISGTAGRAQVELANLSADIELYAAGSGGGSVATGGASGGSSSAASASDSQMDAKLKARDLELVDVQATDLDDNPIRSWEERDATVADHRWAAEMWDTQVSPAFAQGATREELELWDSQRSASGYRRLAGVWDMFLEDPIVLDEGPSGRLSVTSGRHRLEAARQLGVRHLPARVRRSRR